MKARNIVAFVLGAVACIGLYACGHGSGTAMTTSQPSQPMQPTTMTLGTADVLAKTQAHSETGDPFPVDGGAVTVTPVNDETSDPVTVDN